MSTQALLTDHEVAEVLGVTPQHVRANTDRFETETATETSKNGRNRRMYKLGSLPPDAQIEWARRNNVIAMTPAAAPGQLALSLTVPVGPNLSEEDRIEVEKRYRVIEPLIQPERFQAIWAQHKNSRVAVIDWLAKQHKTKRRTLYTWLAAWRSGGLPALIPKDRSDKGKPKIFNGAALDFLLAAAFPKHGAYGKLSVRDIFRAYGDERAWRAPNIGKPLDDFSIQRYARYVTTEGCLAPSAQLPTASYGTFRNWYERIPEIAKTMAREGDEAFHNTQEILSFRSFTDVAPLDYIVMDHRVLDLFCLIPKRGGWKLARPWLTAAIDYRTRKWLGWVICETPSSDSIAAVLKKVFISYGLPVACYYDNGKDFRCQWLEGHAVREENHELGEMEIGMRGVLDKLDFQYQQDLRQFSQVEEQKTLKTAQSEAERQTIHAFYSQANKQLLQRHQQDLQVLLNSQGWRGVFGDHFASQIKRDEALSREWATSTNQSLLMVKVSMQELREISQQAFDQFAQGMGQGIAQAIVYSASIGQAMRAALAATLESVAARCLGESIYALGLGFLRLAEHDPAGATSAFTAAAVFGSAGAVAAIAGRAVAPPQNGASASGGASGSSSASSGSSDAGSASSASAQAQPTVIIHINGSVIGPSGASELCDIINQAVYGNDATLYASHSRTGVPIG